jgi:predicted peptidase
MTMRPQALALDQEIRKRVQLRYLLWLPASYHDAAAQPWPLILFLHGSGERGDDVARVMEYGLPQRLAQGFDLPAIVAAPQCPLASDWTLQDDALLALLDELCATYAVNQRWVYLTGLSMGGRGAWRLAASNPNRFAALIPICGRRPDGVRSAETLRPLCNLPTWVFHGAQDQVVPVEESDAMVAALQACGADVRYTRYPDVGHNAWTPAYAEPELYGWMFSQRRAANEEA